MYSFHSTIVMKNFDGKLEPFINAEELYSDLRTGNGSGEGDVPESYFYSLPTARRFCRYSGSPYCYEVLAHIDWLEQKIADG